MNSLEARPKAAGPSAYHAYKRELISGLEGSVLEVGAGRGANFALLSGVSQWTGVEPSRGRRQSLRRSAPAHARVLAGRAEELPVADASVDAVLATIVLCSVDDQSAALSEVARVLRPGGRFVFFEHVAPPRGTWTYRVLRASSGASRLLDHGCSPVRRTWEVLESNGSLDVRLRWFELPLAFGMRVPYVGGEALRV